MDDETKKTTDGGGKKKKTERVYLGQEFKAKNAGGDVKRKGQQDPYAYLPPSGNRFPLMSGNLTREYPECLSARAQTLGELGPFREG